MVISSGNTLAIIVAGMAGIARGVQLMRLLKHESFCIYERGDDIGESNQYWAHSLWDIPHGKSYAVQVRFVVTAMGVLNIPTGLNDLPVLTDFGNNGVMVIGDGCSADQVIPWILNNHQPHALVQIVRSEQWVAPKHDHHISAFTKWCLRFIPFDMRIRGIWAAYELDRRFVAYRKTEAGAKARNSAAEAIKLCMCSVANPMYYDLLIPRYDLGAKRPVMDHGYLEATNRPIFTLIKCNGTQDLLTPMEVRGIKDEDFRPNKLPSSNSTLHGIECSVVYITRVLRGIWGKILTKRTDAVSVMHTAEAEARFNAVLQTKIEILISTSDVRS
ncbi:hypothetical protein FHL15_005364 [Xylaria flabelliformis]|uniref:FAD/NAD(P)-binding domain-containing protein n=1 Tax=Xylaria flabelliformis TaxID=2512241 RepID=A0A553I0F5_9PEZI|nr:hypothetical protein FHL15_005364 [Xylaria flabelliformis]